MSVIAMHAQLGNGKDEIANYLATLMSPDWQRGAFANAVKDTFCNAFNVDRAFIEKWKRNPEPPPGFKVNVRKGLQNIGDGFREIVDDVWIQIALRDESKNQILSDGRYINEAKTVFEKGGVNVLVYRPGFINDDPNKSESQIRPIVEWFKDNHSEGEITAPCGSGAPYGCQYYHYFFINDGDIDRLQWKVKYQLATYLKGFLADD